jgi:hypothetical protein
MSLPFIGLSFFECPIGFQRSPGVITPAKWRTFPGSGQAPDQSDSSYPNEEDRGFIVLQKHKFTARDTLKAAPSLSAKLDAICAI